MFKFKYNDGNRPSDKQDSDCAVRSIKLVTGAKYMHVYKEIEFLNRSSMNNDSFVGGLINEVEPDIEGVHNIIIAKYLAKLGFRKVNPKKEIFFKDLPKNKSMVVEIKEHLTTFINGVMIDDYDHSEGDTQPIIFYWIKPNEMTRKIDGKYETKRRSPKRFDDK